VCARKGILLENKPNLYEAYRMRTLYYVYKGKKYVFGYVCPNCGHIFRIGMPPLEGKEEKMRLIDIKKAVISDAEKIAIPTEKTYIWRW
jgi:hypothetical protein